MDQIVLRTIAKLERLDFQPKEGPLSTEVSLKSAMVAMNTSCEENFCLSEYRWVSRSGTLEFVSAAENGKRSSLHESPCYGRCCRLDKPPSSTNSSPHPDTLEGG